MKVLFVCTGNIFRSMSAEYCLKDYIKQNNIKNVYVASAGIYAAFEPMNDMSFKTLKFFGIDPSLHKQTKVTKQILESYDLIIAMAQNHKEYLKTHFNVDALLFNEIAYQKATSVKDVDEAVDDYLTNIIAYKEHIRKTIIYIHDAIPEFAKNMQKFVK